MHNEINPQNDWQLEINPPWDRVKSLRDRLREYNKQRGGTHDGINLGIFLRDESEELTGGVSAWLWGKTVEINFLWLSDALRGQGIGQELMGRIEKAAVERGATQAVLSTYTFQAPDFYQRLGYEVVAVIEGLGDDHKKFYLRKTL